MKHRFAFICILLMLVPLFLMGETVEKVIKIKTGDGNGPDLRELAKLKDMNNVNFSISASGEESGDSAFMGVYPADLDFPKAQELKYENTYGVLITGVVKDSPAYTYRLAEDDIIMEMNGKKVMNQKDFEKAKSYYRAGDTVNLTIFRNGEVIHQDFTFGNREQKVAIEQGTGEVTAEKKPIYLGSGGGSYIPMWFDVDMKDTNQLLSAIGFSDLVPDNGLLTQGIAGKITVGKGWFLGGNIQWYGISRKAGDVDSAGVATGYNNYMDYGLSMGGVTLDKRFAFTKGIIGSLGVMLGGASQSIELVHTNNQYVWPTAANATVDDVVHGSTHNKFSKGYLLVQPKAELMVRLLPWLGMRAEGGYAYGYSTSKGWSVKQLEQDIPNTMQDSPNTPFEGWTVTVGPWFGF